MTITPAMSTIRSRRFSYAEAPRQDTEGGSGSRVSSGCVDTLFDAYGKPTEQVGYTDGHYCVTNADRREAARCSSSLLYGEILASGVCGCVVDCGCGLRRLQTEALPVCSGVTKLMDTQHLHAANAQVLYDLGMGVGKLCLQTFVQFPNLRLVFGIELAFSRYKMAEEALLRLVTVQPDSFEVEAMEAGCFIRVCTVPSKDRPLRAAGRCRRRVIELRRGNMWTVRGLNAVDIVVLHTELTATSLSKVNRTINELHRGARFVTYQDISCWSGAPAPYKQLEANRSERVGRLLAPATGKHVTYAPVRVCVRTPARACVCIIPPGPICDELVFH